MRISPWLRRLRAALALATLAAAALAAGGCDVVFPNRSEGEKIYRRLCSECHGADARGNTPRYMGNPYADLRDGLWKNGSESYAIERVVRAGIFGQMPPHPELTAQEMKALIDHIRVLRGEKQAEPAR